MTTPTTRHTRCPDCNGTADGVHVTHRNGCPLAATLAATRASDRAWLRDHPRGGRHRRPITPAENEHMRLTGEIPPDGEVVGDVVLYRFWPGGFLTYVDGRLRRRDQTGAP